MGDYLNEMNENTLKIEESIKVINDEVANYELNED
jgi:hypothetical protein